MLRTLVTPSPGRPVRAVLRAAVCSAVAAIATSACSASYPTAPTATPVALEVQYTSPTGWLLVPDIRSFRAYVVDSDGAYEDVSATAAWSYSPAVLTPISLARFRAVGPGATEVRASHAGLTGSVTVIVQAAPPPYPYLEVRWQYGSTISDPCRGTLTAWLRESFINATQLTSGVAWSSSNPAVATVDAAGNITYHAPGNTEFTATHQGQTAWARCSSPPQYP